VSCWPFHIIINLIWLFFFRLNICQSARKHSFAFFKTNNQWPGFLYIFLHTSCYQNYSVNFVCCQSQRVSLLTFPFHIVKDTKVVFDCFLRDKIWELLII
jgi:hypothetical protein